MESCEREKEVKQFEETKAGVKGLVDSGVTKIPRIFIHPPEQEQDSQNHISSPKTGVLVHDQVLQVPLIDLKGFEQGDRCRRKEIVNGVKNAVEKWGFFQMVNHGIPSMVMEDLLEAVRRFHEQPQEAKKEFYSRDFSRRFHYYSNGNLSASTPADWRDSLSCNFQEDENFEAIPQVCRREISEYFKCIIRVRDMLSEVLSAALGLNTDCLASTGCLKSVQLIGHYYPFCPEPDLTLGATKHSDPSFLAFVLQDSNSGLQVLHQDHWVDVPPVKGALVANVGDLMQVISNDKFKSIEHRVLATRSVEPRLSAACFFRPADRLKPFGPIKELLSEANPPVYRETSFGEYLAYYRSKGQDGTSALPHLRLP